MARSPSRTAIARRAFTLIEAIATMVVLSILGTFGSSIILSNTEGYFDASLTGQLHVELSISMDRIVRELRMIELDSAATGMAPNIDSVTASSMTWRNDAGNVFSLSLSGNNLMLAVDGAAANLLLSEVTMFSIQVFDEDNAALAASLSGISCDPIRRVSVSITLTRYGVSETLGTRVFIRSMMSGGGA